MESLPLAPSGTADCGLLELRNITRRYGSVTACDSISFSVGVGEVRGLLGQNGAGKSTLMKIVSGVERADAGEVRIDGVALPPGDLPAATGAGIGMVHQHFSLVPRLTVWENVILGERGAVNPAIAMARVEEIARRFSLDIDPTVRIEDLSPGQRQRVEIIKCLRRDPRVIVLDEPTSVLTQAESHMLFDVLGGLVQDGGRALVLISHRLEEIMTATDMVTILRDGKVAATYRTSETTARDLAGEMLGREVSLHEEGAALGLGGFDTPSAPSATARTTEDEPMLRIYDATVRGSEGQWLLWGLTLDVAIGEIVGVAGVEGNGQAALVDLLSNLHTLERGRVQVDGRDVSLGRRNAFESVAVIPADRHDSGCVLEMSIAENLVLGRTGVVRRRGFLSRRALRAHAETLVRDFDVSTPNVDLPMSSLSGGNQQRVVLARELAGNPRVLVAAQPTHGLDVGAMEYLWGRLRAAAAAGTAVLLISTELDEILALADRIAVIHRGAIVGEMSRADVDMERLGMLMGGEKG